MKIVCRALIGLPILAVAVLAAFQSNQDTKPADKVVEGARLNNLGVAYMNQQLFEKALKSFDQAAAIDSSMEIAQVNRGIALLNLQKVDEAQRVLEEAVKANSRDGHAWYNLGLLYKNTNNTQGAIDAFRRVTEIDGDDADAWYFLGSVYPQAR